MGCFPDYGSKSPEARVRAATSALFLNAHTCNDYKACYFLRC